MQKVHALYSSNSLEIYLNKKIKLHIKSYISKNRFYKKVIIVKKKRIYDKYNNIYACAETNKNCFMN